MRIELSFEVLANGKIQKNIPDLDDGVWGGIKYVLGINHMLNKFLLNVCSLNKS